MAPRYGGDDCRAERALLLPIFAPRHAVYCYHYAMSYFVCHAPGVMPRYYDGAHCRRCLLLCAPLMFCRFFCYADADFDMPLLISYRFFAISC